MAFGDMLKKAAEKGFVMTYDAMKKGKQLVDEQKAEMERRRILEKIRKEREGAVCPECQYGECYHFRGAFYCFCDETVACEEKEIRKDFTYKLLHLDALPIVRKIALAKKIEDWAVLNEDFERADQIIQEAANEYIEKYLPNFKNYEELIIDHVLEGAGFAGKGMAALFEKLDFKPDDVEDIEEKFYIVYNYGIGRSCGRHIGHVSPEDAYLNNVSLWNRSIIDFEFTLTVFSVLDSFEGRQLYRDVEVIRQEDLYDELGNIKPVGNVDDGKDSILGVIQSWEKDKNEEDNLIENKLIPLYYKMLNHELPTVREIYSETFREVFGK